MRHDSAAHSLQRRRGMWYSLEPHVTCCAIPRLACVFWVPRDTKAVVRHTGSQSENSRKYALPAKGEQWVATTKQRGLEWMAANLTEREVGAGARPAVVRWHGPQTWMRWKAIRRVPSRHASPGLVWCSALLYVDFSRCYQRLTQTWPISPHTDCSTCVCACATSNARRFCCLSWAGELQRN